MFKLCLFSCFILFASAIDVPSSAYLPPTSTHQQQTIHNDGYQKHFYHFTAPEEHFEQKQIQAQLKPQAIKKNLQVIFIKPPEEKQHKKALANLIQNNVVKEKTHIYVLTPEHNHAAHTKKIQQIQQAAVHHHKPEVHYVNYHTPAEAHNIQQKIIQQYGGKPSEIHTVQSGENAQNVHFINTNSNHHSNSEGVEYIKNSSPTGIDVVPGSSYLPPGLRF